MDRNVGGGVVEDTTYSQESYLHTGRGGLPSSDEQLHTCCSKAGYLGKGPRVVWPGLNGH